MGIQDRAYFRGDSPETLSLRPQSAVGTLLVVTIAVWVAQLIFRNGEPGWGGAVTRFLAATPEDLFGGFPKFWKILSANFAHDWVSPWHVFGNMIFLFFFGRELEYLLGRRDFYALYFIGGGLAIFAEVLVQRFEGHQTTLVLGASGAVTAVVVLYTLLYPTRRILFFFFIPLPVWALCAFFVAQDVLGATSSTPSGVAHFAHLVGALFGLLYWRFDLRLERWIRFGRRFLRGAAKPPSDELLHESAPASAAREPTIVDPVTRRIDELLDKIHASGLGSLSDEERQFLSTNSAKYRRT